VPNPTISHLKLCIPGQTDTWYQRIAAEITAGRMPLPQILEPEPVAVAPEPTADVIVELPRFVVLTEAVPLSAVIISPPPPLAVAVLLSAAIISPPQPLSETVAEPPKTRKQTQVPTAPAPAPASKSPVPLQASQHQLEQAAKSARAKAPQQSKPPSPKTHPPRALISLLRGDYAGADRLFLKLKLSNPGRDDKWIWDKALWDLQRDRM
jgi:hypothetical protein